MPRKSMSSGPLNEHPIPEVRQAKPGMSKFSIIIFCVVFGVGAIMWAKNTVTSLLRQKPVETVKTIPAENRTLGSASSTNDGEISALIARISRLIVVKQDEAPTVATIQDVSLLRQQDPKFYKEAENGDRLVIWSDQAILYSTKQDRLLAVVPVSLPPSTGSATSTQQVNTAISESNIMNSIKAEGATIEVRNGSGVPGMGKIVVDKLKALGFNVLPAKDVTAGKEAYANIAGTIIRWDADSSRFPQTDKMLTTLESVQDKGTANSLETGVKGNYLVIVGGKFQK
ncbi:LytR C-terminal domain-containing protein [Patescibacteria group bacterium]|nr:LytR C-terminal domain-containing protein [Patescibacteria group bacterium]